MTLIFLKIFILINTLLLASFFWGTKFFFPQIKMANPAKRQHYATFLGFLLLFYFIAAAILAVLGKPVFLLFLIAPFAMVSKITYKKLPVYVDLHILLFSLSLGLAIWEIC